MNKANKKKIMAICIILIILLQIVMPIIGECYSDLENEADIIEDNEKIDINDNKIDEYNDESTIENSNGDTLEISDNSIIDANYMENEEIIEKTIEEDKADIQQDSENIEQSSQIVQKDNKIIELKKDILQDSEIIENDDFEIETNDEGISVMSASGFGVGAGNENEFRNAFYNTNVSELTTSQVIRLTSTYTVNHNLRIDSSSVSGGNSLHLSSGCGIIIQSGCVLTLDGIVVDGRTWGNDDSKVCVTVRSGGVLMLTNHAIIDGRNKKLGN